MAKEKETAVAENAATEDAVAETPAEKKDERVELFVPKGAANDDPNLFISVNGVGYLLPRGKKSMVPPHIKAEYERSVAAQSKMDERVDELLAEANKPLPGTV